PPDFSDRGRAWMTMLASALDSVRRRFCRQRWTIGVVDRPVEAIVRARRLDAPRWLRNQPDDRFYADPFLLRSIDGRLEVLAEAAEYVEQQGYLVRLAVADSGTAVESDLLRTREHLSYPSLLRDGNDTYVIPESWQTGRLAVYRLDPTTGAVDHDGD